MARTRRTRDMTQREYDAALAKYGIERRKVGFGPPTRQRVRLVLATVARDGVDFGVDEAKYAVWPRRKALAEILELQANVRRQGEQNRAYAALHDQRTYAADVLVAVSRGLSGQRAIDWADGAAAQRNGLDKERQAVLAQHVAKVADAVVGEVPRG